MYHSFRIYMSQQYYQTTLEIFNNMNAGGSTILSIYQECMTLISMKRKLIKSAAFPQIIEFPINQRERRVCSMKIAMCYKKIFRQLFNQTSYIVERSHNAGYYSGISEIIENLRNNKEILTKEDQLKQQTSKLIEQWNSCQDPLIYYQINERIKLKNSLSQKINDIKAASQESRQTRKPLYIRKIQRELRQNLQSIHQQQRNYNSENVSDLSINCKSIRSILAKIREAVTKIQIQSAIQLLKNQLLIQYVDVFSVGPKDIRQNDIKKYRKDLRKTLTEIQRYLEDQKSSYSNLLSYLSTCSKIIVENKKKIQQFQDNMILETLRISSEINLITCFQEVLFITDQMQKYSGIAEIIKQFMNSIKESYQILEQMVSITTQFTKNYDQKTKINKEQFIDSFIGDKQYLQKINKKEKSFELSMFRAFIDSIEKMDKLFSQISKSRYQSNSDLKISKVLDKLFKSYFAEVQQKQKEKSDSKNLSTASSNVSTYQKNNNTQFLKKIEQFSKSLSVFNDTQINWNTQYFQCSLGPRLLIHGYLIMFQDGIYYQSSFNKKNLFFGKTKIFIFKEQITEISKESALYLFPDVIKVMTKKGQITFHSLGKRQKMYSLLTETYFPENNVDFCEQTSSVCFNLYEGSLESAQQKIQQFTTPLEIDLGKRELKHCSLQKYFKRYLTNEKVFFKHIQFVYQGNEYDNFKTFSLLQLNATNIKGTSISPKIPSYFLFKNEEHSKDDDIISSQCHYNYGKSVPMIPFVSKGGEGLCVERNVYYWGGPFKLVVDIFSELKGFSLTEGMVVRWRQVLTEVNENLVIHNSIQIDFTIPSAMNNLLRSPAISSLKSAIQSTYEVITKYQRSKTSKKQNKKNKQADPNEKALTDVIQKLEKENNSLRKQIKLMAIAFALIYFGSMALILNI